MALPSEFGTIGLILSKVSIARVAASHHSGERRGHRVCNDSSSVHPIWVHRKKGGLVFRPLPSTDITTQGRSIAEAKQNLMEASEFFFISCLERGTLDNALRELGFVKVQAHLQRVPHNGFKMVIPIPMRFSKPQPCPA